MAKEWLTDKEFEKCDLASVELGMLSRDQLKTLILELSVETPRRKKRIEEAMEELEQKAYSEGYGDGSGSGYDKGWNNGFDVGRGV